MTREIDDFDAANVEFDEVNKVLSLEVVKLTKEKRDLVTHATKLEAEAKLNDEKMQNANAAE